MTAALMMDTLPRRAAQYTPPAEWQTVSVRDLVAGTSRATDGDRQLDFLGGSKTASAGAVPTVFVAGDTELLKRPCVSVIGTRKVSPDGMKRAQRIARDLVKNGVVVVSGLAEGVDTEAMSMAIASGGRTIGVIGTPLDKAYPAKNASLQEEVYAHHLLVSQFRSGDRVFQSNFPQRNKLMAYLSDASVVIEAADTSGTLHQAAECTRLGRWLFIARSVIEDKSLTWPAKFLKYPTCVALDSVDDIISRIGKAP